ncbi:uncharacterized protein MONOS_13716 [Monocercomonoides exilis]|uniref:uncharacterized protein n=1 Tax=Monocercomonoides exilis TaxID=2049356 RepID=UPI00355A8187|nr:hypothetical protein MONOS_13716 [Monocercomonoides exilis]|eukprot:MONOS_13716.1-p1 / transcript=MONOS_13716.1 / gene=MONOS_13716 / organism=Monocercomonoides_exilis_PA203 / gene_product=unspecified product / transcript_product=unspecified product / location=Mono_scaffold00870:21838-25908(-) / protein_length=1357 / sequence_SO=supercontig / SO=protein_coding / is_pseudo=false
MFIIIALFASAFSNTNENNQSFSEREFIAERGRVQKAPITIVFISDRGDDSNPNCGVEAEPCKSVAKGIERLGDDPGDKSIKIVDFAEIQYEFIFNKEFSLTMDSRVDSNTRGMLDFDLKDLVEKGKFHIINEKILKLEHLTFNLILSQTEQLSTETDEESAIILSRGFDGDFAICDCGISLNRWTEDLLPFSLLSVTEGKISINKFYWILSSNFKNFNGAILHISEDATLQKLRGFEFGEATLNKECALKLPSSFTLEGSNFDYANRKTAGPAILEAKSEENKKVEISISECSFTSISPLSEKGSSLYFEMMHPESELNVIDSTFRNGEATKGGGMMIGMTKGKVKLENVEFSGCVATEGGGGLYALELTQMAGFECNNVKFERCTAKSGGGVYLTLDEENIKGDGIFFKDCFFAKNEGKIDANDVVILCKGDSEMNKNPFDAACISSTKKERVVVKRPSTTSIIHDDWLAYNSFEVDVDAINGVDNDECGKEGNKPCKTMKKAIENSLTGRLFRIYTTKNCNKYDIEPITIEGRKIEVLNRDVSKISITTALDETKVLPGEGVFNLKQQGSLLLYEAEINVDTTRASGRSNGLIVTDGDDASAQLCNVNITATDENQELNCALIECKTGTLYLVTVTVENFISSSAIILCEAANAVTFFGFLLNKLSVKSATQSVVTVLEGCKQVSVTNGRILNCWSVEHKIGGCIYMEVGNSANEFSVSHTTFRNCSVRNPTSNEEANALDRNEESKGGAMFVRVADGVTDPVKLSLENLNFIDCAADRGEYIYLSLPVGREQLKDELLIFEMEDIYGEPNGILLEERKGDEANIIDLLTDEANRLPYHSSRIFVGGEKASNGKSCGSKTVPCDRISTGTKHNIPDEAFMMLFIGMVSVDEPFETKQPMTFASAPDSSSSSLLTAEPNRGALHVESKIYAGKSLAVFENWRYSCTFRHVDIEYPDAVEGEALNLIFTQNQLTIIDVVLRPWFTELTGESVQGGEGKPLPYKLIVIEKEFGNFKQLAIYGRNGNTNKGRRADEEKSEKNQYFLEMKGKKTKPEPINKIKEAENGLCLWDSGLVTLHETRTTVFEDCSFVNISEGVIFTDGSPLNLSNCSFANNHPIDADWEKFPSLRHNIRAKGKQPSSVCVISLTQGSDGTEGKPFGMIADGNASGEAAKKMDSLFFSPVLKNVTIVKDAEGANRGKREANGKDKENEEETVTGIVHGSYLFPCELTFEAAKERKGEELKWVDCPVTEFAGEAEMKVKIPKALLDVDDQTSVMCHLSYSSGITANEKKHTEDWFLVKRKEDNPKKLTRTQLIIIIASSCAFAVVVAVIVVVVVCVVKRRKRRDYKEIKEGSKF